jgi:hypothetical protein
MSDSMLVQSRPIVSSIERRPCSRGAENGFYRTAPFSA